MVEENLEKTYPLAIPPDSEKQQHIVYGPLCCPRSHPRYKAYNICPSPPSLIDSFGLTCLIKCILPLVTSFLPTLASPKRDFEGPSALSEWQKAKNLDDVAADTFSSFEGWLLLPIGSNTSSLSPKAKIAVLCHQRPRRGRRLVRWPKHRANGVSHFELAEFFRPRFLVSV